MVLLAINMWSIWFVINYFDVTFKIFVYGGVGPQLWAIYINKTNSLYPFIKFPLFLRLREKNILDSNGRLYKHVSDNSKKILSIGNFEILSVVVSCTLRFLTEAST